MSSLMIGKIFVVGIGSGNINGITNEARKILEFVEVIAGYNTYVNLIKGIIGDKKIIGRGMRQEVERCQLAIEEAQNGNNVAIVSSGDAGVYGMAGLVLEMVLELPKSVQPELEIIPGISAVNLAAALLGAPLMNDFAIISLSDLMTPWEIIENRVRSAINGDFVIAFYNPKSQRRFSQLLKVQKILLNSRPSNTPVGIVTNAGRLGEKKIITTLEKFTEEEINMFSVVLVGNSQTFVKSNFMITPRGYKI